MQNDLMLRKIVQRRIFCIGAKTSSGSDWNSSAKNDVEL